LVFYDFETSGLQTAFDQILQIGAIKTDEQLDELDAINIRCRLLPHIVPSPGALRTTRVRPAQLVDLALPTHYETVKLVRNKFSEWSPATFIGFNSMSFDEELLRQSLFQTLHPAYLTNTSGNSRADVMRAAIAIHVYAPNKIAVPLNADGKESFRLADLARANGCDVTNAHDALADVKMTISLARLMRERAPEIWQIMLERARKGDVVGFVRSQTILSLTDRMYGRTHSYLVTPCGVNAENSSALAAFDISNKPDEYIESSVDELIEVLRVTRKKIIRTIRANAQPIVMPANLAPAATKALGIEKSELERRGKVVAENKSFHERVGEAMARQYDDNEPREHIEQRIYDGFPVAQDSVLMEKFHEADWTERPAILADIRDDRVREFGRRLIYFERPELLPEADRIVMEAWIGKRMLNEDVNVPWTTVAKAHAEADDLLLTATADEQVLLNETKAFLRALTTKYRREQG